MSLAKYIYDNEIKLDDLFGQAIYTQTIKTKKQQKDIDVINSPDFFTVLRSINALPYDVGSREEAHENLKQYLCIEPAHHDSILYVKKLKQVIQFFATNREMRRKAEEYFATSQEPEKKGDGEAEPNADIMENAPEPVQENVEEDVQEPIDRKEHNDVMKRQLGERFNYDEEFPIESEPEAKTPPAKKVEEKKQAEEHNDAAVEYKEDYNTSEPEKPIMPENVINNDSEVEADYELEQQKMGGIISITN